MSFRNFAWAVCGLTLVIIVCAVALAALNHYDVREAPYFLVADATAALVGGLIASRRPRNPVGWIVAAHALAVAVAVIETGFAAIRPGNDEGIPNPLGIESLEGSRGLGLAFEEIASPLWLAVGALSYSRPTSLCGFVSHRQKVSPVHKSGLRLIYNRATFETPEASLT
jgi:hypothetical protein